MSHTITLATGATITVPDLRGDVPVYRPPDRQEWARTKGGEPYRLEYGEPASFTRKFASKAKGAIARDLGTIDFEKAIAAQTNMDMIFFSVRGLVGLPDHDVVFFDPEDEHFWVYPNAPF